MRKQQKAAEAKKLETERLQGFLQEMLKEEENKYCADCEAKQPRWASWNLGVFLCIRCAGLHRNLGVHISKVKSVTLDSWTPEQVQSMRVMGNAKARAVYECDLPTVFRRPQTDQSLEAFIRSKYEAKRYLMKDWSPPRIDIADLPPHPSNIHDKKGAVLEKAKIGGHKGNSKLHSSSDPDTLTGKENQNDKVQNSAVQLIDFSTSPIKQQGQVVNSTALIGVDLFAPVETTTADQQQTTVVGEATVDDIFGPIVSANASSNHLQSTHPTMTVSSPNLIFEQPKGSFATAFDNGMVPTETPAQSQQSTALSSDLLGLDLDRLCSISGVEVAQPNNTHQASAMLRTSHSVSTGLDASLFTTEPASVDTKKSTKEILDLFNKR